MAALAELIDFLYPPRCAACGARFSDAACRICADCIALLEPIPQPLCAVCGGPLESAASFEPRCARCIATPPCFRRASSVARYRAAAEDDPRSLPAMLRRHKYGLDQAVGRALLEYLGSRLPIDRGAIDLVAPVPLHWRRLLWRGFNQAALLAEEVSRRLELPLKAAVLRRVRATRPQTARNHDARRSNIYRAFAVRYPAQVLGRRVLLVDDVMTTGATVDECARALMDAGARAVDVFTLARVL